MWKSEQEGIVRVTQTKNEGEYHTEISTTTKNGSLERQTVWIEKRVDDDYYPNPSFHFSSPAEFTVFAKLVAEIAEKLLKGS